ncbi:protein TolR [Alphaproteobacteria bacterium]|nr:protein TolR [Alphaproteobacteria bacterium]GHS96697.1 protein TolR [Alphaproteobacteria bacterium]
MAHYSSASGRKVRSFRQNSAINVTPLVDVMLVLLIIFVITAPMMTVGIKVDLPQTTAAQLNDAVEPLVVSIRADGQIYIQEMPVDKAHLLEKLAGILQQNKDACVYVQGDKNLKYATVVEVMSLISASGIAKVSLMAELPNQAKTRP